MHPKILISASFLAVLIFLTPHPVRAQLPPSPQGPHVWCLTGKAEVKLNWFPVDSATSYQIRLDADAPSWSGTCTGNDKCLSSTASEITIPITPAIHYDWWVHAVNDKGWSTPALQGVEFSCNIPVPTDIHYQCMPNNTVVLNWQATNVAGLYDVSIDADSPSWNSTCTAPDRCLSVSTNTATFSILPGKEYAVWLQAKDTKGNKSQQSSSIQISCSGVTLPSSTPTKNPTSMPTNTPPTPTPTFVPTNSPTKSPTPTLTKSPTPTPTNIPTTEPTQNVTPTTTSATPTIIVSSSTPAPSHTPEPTIQAADCARRTEGDANCDGTISLEDSECWKGVYILNFLSVSNGCRFTNFDEDEGTNILDFAIWYSYREQ